MSFLKQKIRIRLKSFNFKLINESFIKIIKVITHPNIKIIGPIPLPTKIKRFDILRSPHVDKTSRDQFEIRTYLRIMDIINYRKGTLNKLMRIILPAGVEINIKLK